MFCKWCGLESEQTEADVCSWCGKPFSVSAAQTTTSAQPSDTLPSSETLEDEPQVGSAQAATLPEIGGRVAEAFVPATLPGAPIGEIDEEGPLTTGVGPAQYSSSLSGDDSGLSGSAAPSLSVTAAPQAPSGGPSSPGNAERPALEAIPIKGKGASGSPPGVIPIAKKGASTDSPKPQAPTVSAPTTPAPKTIGGAPQTGRPLVPSDNSAPAPPSLPIKQPGGAPITPPTSAPPITPLAGRDLTGAPSPGGPPAPAVPASGRTWYCRFCGMQSETSDRCSWCRHDLKSLPPSSGKPIHVVSTHHTLKGRGHATPAPTPEPPGPRAATKGSAGVSGGVLTGQPIRADVKTAGGTLPAVPATDPPSGNGAGKPILGTFQAGKSKYYPDKVFDPVSQSHYDADSGRAEGDLPASKIVTEETNDLRQLSIFAAIYAVVLCAAGLIGHALPQSYLVVLGVATFLAGVLLPIFRVAPFMSDDSNDLPYALALTLICGPFVGAMFYGVLWIIRGDANPAVVGIFLANLLARMTLDLSTGRSVIDLFSRMLPQMDPASFAASWMPLAGLFGWMCADPFKRADE